MLSLQRERYELYCEILRSRLRTLGGPDEKMMPSTTAVYGSCTGTGDVLLYPADGESNSIDDELQKFTTRVNVPHYRTTTPAPQDPLQHEEEDTVDRISYREAIFTSGED